MLIDGTNISDFSKVWLFALILCALSGCVSRDSDPKDTYLLRAGTSMITLSDFDKSLEIAKIAYGYEAIRNPEILGQIRTDVLKQLAERVVLAERARELGIAVSDEELEKAIASAKEGYPEGEFEKTLLESAIPYDSWKTESKNRLLMEKVIEKDLEQEMPIAPEDISEYVAETGQTAGEKNRISNEMIVKLLKKRKAEEAYPAWIEKLRRKYKVEINETEWKKITGA